MPDLDLNLLVVLDVLLEERHVTRAAARLGTTQSTLSSALARLREALGDPLLVRTARGMIPTPRAMEMQPVLRAALDNLSRALEGQDDFDASSSRRTFVIAATDYPQFVLAGPLMKRLRQEAPGVSLEIRAIQRRFPWESLGTADLDLVLAGGAIAPVGLQSRRLFQDDLVCLLREEHPALEGSWSLETYLGLPHVEAQPIEGVTLVDGLLAEAGRSRTISLRLPEFLVAPFVVMETDLCFTLARRIADPLLSRHPLAVRPFPMESHPLGVRAYWHPRVHNDPGHRWLRRQLNQVAIPEPAP